MVGRWGMSDVDRPHRGGRRARRTACCCPGQSPTSEATQRLVDEEVRRIVDEAEQDTILLIERERPRLEALARALLEQGDARPGRGLRDRRRAAARVGGRSARPGVASSPSSGCRFSSRRSPGDDDEQQAEDDGHELAQGQQQLHVCYRGAAMLVAIDGPAGAGKSTVARAVARALGFTYLDSGAMYRAVALSGARDPSGAGHPLRRRPRAARRRGRQRRDPHARDLPGGLAARRRSRRARGAARPSSARSSPTATGWPRAATSARSWRPTPSSRCG